MTNRMVKPDKLMVCRKRCNECLFGPNKVVGDLSKERILKEIDAGKYSYFVCHKGSLTQNDQLVCRGWYDANPTAKIVIFAKILKCEEFVDVPDVKEIL